MKKKIFFIIFVLLVCGALGFYFYQKLVSKDKNIDVSDQLAGDNNGDTNIVNIGSVAMQGEGDMRGVKIEQIDIANDKSSAKIPVPDLDREIKITAAMDDNAKKIATAKIQELSSQLKKDSDNLENWLVLGVYRKTIGDLEGVREIWEYAGAIRPKNSISFNNLGELYAYYLKDNKKAEENYKKALENDPSAIYIYRNFFDFYRYFLKDTAKARAILEQGIAANPGESSSDLQNLLNSLK